MMIADPKLILSSLCSFLLVFPASAQILPDTTLGAESTIITPMDGTRDRIDGGAIRDINLFHSFLEFNIDRDRSVYFSNPPGVENILTRVTGQNLSNINGRLGVLGEANLFLINPNGIIFGENATLDIRGSFIASTAEGIQLGNSGFFSATDINNSQLLAVQPGALFSNALHNHQARITNQGNLQVGGNLTLDSDFLNLQGQLHAQGDLILNARDTLTLRDSNSNPFLATAGGEMTLQGNQSVDIFILNHPDSSLYSRGNMTLRSANPVIGDAHYQTGGNYRVETLDGSLGQLHSPDDPVILANGDFSINSYFGASLHVLAGGSINIPGGILILGPDTVGNSINPTNTPNLATVTTSRGQTLTIDGSAEATLDLRAGIDWGQLGGLPGNTTIGTDIFGLTPPPTAFQPATGADLNVGTVLVLSLNPGRVLLTNQYHPNPNLNGNITVANIINFGGEVAIDSRNNITNNGFIATLGLDPTQDGGNISFLAAGDITLANNLLLTSGRQSGAITLHSLGNVALDNNVILSNSNASTPNAIGGDLNITARNLTATNAGITSLLEGQGKAGSFNFNIQDTARIEGSIITSLVQSGARGNSGDMNINAGFLDIADNSQLLLATVGQGNAGNLRIDTRQGVKLTNDVSVGTLTRGQGNSGILALNTAGSLQVLNNSAISTNTFGQGNAGDLSLNVRGGIVVDNNSSVNSDVGAGAVGNGGQVNVTTGSLQLSHNSLMGALTAGQGNAGTFTLQTTGSLQVRNNSSLVAGTFSQGNAGNLNLQVGQDTVVDHFSIISSDVYPGAVGNGGQVNLTTRSLQISNQSVVGTITQGQGNAGTATLNVADSLTISNQAILGTTTLGRGNAGNLNVAVGRNTILDRGFINSDVLDNGVGNGGQINLATDFLTVRNGGVISASTNGQGNAGNVDIRVRQNAILDGFNVAPSSIRTQVGSNATGNGGSLSLQANNLSVMNGAVISAETQGRGNAGNVQINIWGDAIFAGAGSGVLSSATADAVGNGGQINLKAGTLQLSNGAVLSSSAAGVGVAGGIGVNTGFLRLDRSRILTETRSGDGGNIGLNVDGILLLRNGSLISTTAGTAGVGGNGGNIDINADFVIGVPLENSDITANAFEGRGGRITITTNGIYGLQFRNALTPLSDITASSEFGLNGTFTLNLLSFPAEQGVNALPEALVDAEGLVGRNVCAVQNNRIAGGSSFVVTGKGGLPVNPVDLMAPSRSQVEWANRSPGAVSVRSRPTPLNVTQIQPIQGWVVTPEGKIELTAVAPTAGMGNRGYAYPTCENWL